MLRVTRIGESGVEVVMRVEGKCVGPWVGALEESVAGILATGKRLRLELGDLDYVDERGVRLLRGWRERGVRLENCRGLVLLQLKV